MALDSQSQSVVTTLVVGIVVGILLMGIMFLFRNNPIYSPKKHKKLIGTILPSHYPSSSAAILFIS